MNGRLALGGGVEASGGILCEKRVHFSGRREANVDGGAEVTFVSELDFDAIIDKLDEPVFGTFLRILLREVEDSLTPPPLLRTTFCEERLKDFEEGRLR
jgi:hypothetical protein